jgi:hypothetical protein
MYKKALSEFIKFGKFVHFPTKYIYQWMGIILNNTAKLRANTEWAGHIDYGMFPMSELEEAIEQYPDFFKGLIKKFGKPNDDYSYDLVNYQGSQIKVQIVCNKKDFSGNPHGVFSINPDAFIQGKGCPKCGNHLSKSEDEIYDYITSVLTKESVIKRDKKILGGKELDILVPDAKIAFEFDGIRWHSEKFKNTKHFIINTDMLKYSVYRE